MKEITATIISFVLLLLCAGHFVPASALGFAIVFGFIAVIFFMGLVLVSVFCPHWGQGNMQTREQRFDTPRFWLRLNNENIHAGVCGMSAFGRAYICLVKTWVSTTALWAMSNNTKCLRVKPRMYQQARSL